MSVGELLLDKFLAIIAAVSAFCTLIVSYVNRQRLTDLHVQINSRMDQLLEKAGLLGKAAGKAEAKLEAKIARDDAKAEIEAEQP
jgi:hypothetical protein